MAKYVLDTNLYIAADRDAGSAEELVGFYRVALPRTYLHAVVVQELMAGTGGSMGIFTRSMSPKPLP